MEFSAYLNQQTRLDAYLCEIFKISRSTARKYCENNFVKVNRRNSRSGVLINNQDLISINLALEPVIPGNFNSKIKVEIIEDNKDFIIINKPVALHCVRLKNSDSETIADYLATKFPETLKASNDIRESGLVNRLDYYTSGILIAAKSKTSWLDLRNNKEMLKTYYALVHGRPQTQTIEAALENKSNKKVKISEKGIPRKTELVFSKEIKPNISLVKLQGNNFSRHQIRAHLAYIGAPLLSDTTYGGSINNFISREGFFLHSENLKFLYKNKSYSFTACSEELEEIKKAI